jgi:hypothetical protein
MSATFFWQEDNGAATGSPARGTTRTANRTECNWKNIDDSTTAYSSVPVTAGNNSYQKYQFGTFSGTFNQILSVQWGLTSGQLGAGLLLKGWITGDYRDPNTTASGSWYNLSSGDISTGYAVLVGATGPEAAGKATSTTNNPAYTHYLATQVISTIAAAAGDSGLVRLTLFYNEN